jgi:hypothetical protein
MSSDWTPKKLKRGKKYDVDSIVVLQGFEDLKPEDVIIACVSQGSLC